MTYNMNDFLVKDWLPPAELNGGWSIQRDGDRTVMRRKDKTWMDDFRIGTGYDNTFEFIEKAKGNVLITGLGIGCIPAYLSKLEKIKSITIIEVTKSLFDYVGERLKTQSLKIDIIYADAMTYKPFRRYDWAWHDVFLDYPLPSEKKLFEDLYRDHVDNQLVWQREKK